MSAQHLAVINRVGNGVGVPSLFEDVLGGAVAAYGAVKLLVAGVVVKDGRAGKAEQLGFGEKGFDGLMVIAKLGAVAFVEDDHDAFIQQWTQALFVRRPPLVVLLIRSQRYNECMPTLRDK